MNRTYKLILLMLLWFFLWLQSSILAVAQTDSTKSETITSTPSVDEAHEDKIDENFSSLDAEPIDTNDEGKSVDQLLDEAEKLFIREQPIDARTKLLRALKIAPDDFRPHMMLGAYYLSEVGHFRLAYRYSAKALEIFERQNGSDPVVLSEDPDKWRQHARLLLLLGESQLNLDRYQDALSTYERFEKAYWDAGIAASKAWVLMKLKRVDEAISVARWGLLRSARRGSTYNILGILLSLKGKKDISLSAFSEAIKAEAELGRLGQISTPLNNSGEVYREWFEENLAKACFMEILRMPDGCDHILPSLNLVLVLIDELRLIEAEQTLKNFETCFKQNSIRSDTEHRALIALGHAKIALRKGDTMGALNLLQKAEDETQWFGKIGTTAEDVQLAIAITKAQALNARASELATTISSSIADYIANSAEANLDKVKAWWLRRLARNIALEKLSDFEDLYIRHSDAMLEYPTLGDTLAEFSLVSLRARLKRMGDSDPRPNAQAYYLLYLGQALLQSGNYSNAEEILTKLDAQWRTREDRLVKAQTEQLLLKSRQNRRAWYHRMSITEEIGDVDLINSIYSLNPAMLHQSQIALPISSIEISSAPEMQGLANNLAEQLLSHSFYKTTPEALNSTKYSLRISLTIVPNNTRDNQESTAAIAISLIERTTGATVVNFSKEVPGKKAELYKVANLFIVEVFKHSQDPAPEPLPKIPVLEGVFKDDNANINKE